MSVLLLIALLAGGLAISAFTGPMLMRRAAPALSRIPRAGATLLLATVVMWLVAAVGIGPLLAWVMTGPSGRTVGICQRCIETSNPWTKPLMQTGIPSLVPALAPLALLLILVVAIAVRAWRRGRSTRAQAAILRAQARSHTVAGHRVLILDDPSRRVFALARRHGGIFVTEGALAVLEGDEVAAVLEHESAHLRQRHHLITALADHLGAILRPIPLFRSVADAVPLYLEIAADNAARTRTGTRALAAALLKLGGAHSHSTPGHSTAGDSTAGDSTPGIAAPTVTIPAGAALHAAGPDRFRALVAPEPGARGFGTAVATSAQATALVTLSAVIHIPWLAAVTSGCT